MEYSTRHHKPVYETRFREGRYGFDPYIKDSGLYNPVCSNYKGIGGRKNSF